MAEFVVPEFLKNQTVEKIYQRIQNNLPPDIDKSEGSHTYNLTYPTAYEEAYLSQYIITEALKLIWAKYSYGIYTDYHAAERGLTRIEAACAIGKLTITCDADTEIPQGSIFSTKSVNGEPAIDFETIERVLPENAERVVEVAVKAKLAGADGNVAPNTIVINTSNIKGIKTVTNQEKTDGGVDAESDISLIERIEEYDRSQGKSFIGNKADYRRWAKEVNGVGEVTVLDPVENNTAKEDELGNKVSTEGTVTIVALNEEGGKADPSLCAAIYNYIMDPLVKSFDGTENSANDGFGYNRLAPYNAKLEVVGAETEENFVISVTIKLDDSNKTIDNIDKTQLLADLTDYLVTTIESKEIILTKVAAIISNTKGVADYKELKINGKEENYTLSNGKVPTINDDTLLLTQWQE